MAGVAAEMELGLPGRRAHSCVLNREDAAEVPGELLGQQGVRLDGQDARPERQEGVRHLTLAGADVEDE